MDYCLPFPLGWICALAKMAMLLSLRLMITNFPALNFVVSVRNFTSSVSHISILLGSNILETVQRDTTIFCCWVLAKCFST